MNEDNYKKVIIKGLNECQCFNDPYDKLRVYCNGCNKRRLSLSYKLITKELLEDEKNRGIRVGENWQESLEFEGYDSLLRKCKIECLLSSGKFIS
jgi:hypothetical protein